MSWLIFVLLILMLTAGVWAVLASELLHAAIALGLTSVMLSLVLFEMTAPWAAVFELSVCAGLITVVFISTISMTRRFSLEEEKARARQRIKRFIWLPVLLFVCSIMIAFVLPGLLEFPELKTVAGESLDVRRVLWEVRRLDLVGQILIITAGIFGVVVLFKAGEGRT